jgi:hypothetical protein
VPAEQLASVLGIRSLDYRPEHHSVVISDRTLAT